VTLVFFGIGVPFDVAELQPSAIGHSPFGPLRVVGGANLGEQDPGAGDYFLQLLELPAEEYADSGFGVAIGMLQPIADGAFGLAAAASAAIENLEDGALD
jgi:hypothetical protein